MPQIQQKDLTIPDDVVMAAMLVHEHSQDSESLALAKYILWLVEGNPDVPAPTPAKE